MLVLGLQGILKTNKLKIVKEKIMKKEPSEESISPKYTKVRRCITPEGRVVKNELNPNLNFN